MQTDFHWTVDGTRHFDELAKSSTSIFASHGDVRDRSGNPFNYARLTAMKNDCDQGAHVFLEAVPITESESTRKCRTLYEEGAFKACHG